MFLYLFFLYSYPKKMVRRNCWKVMGNGDNNMFLGSSQKITEPLYFNRLLFLSHCPSSPLPHLYILLYSVSHQTILPCQVQNNRQWKTLFHVCRCNKGTFVASWILERQMDWQPFHYFRFSDFELTEKNCLTQRLITLRKFSQDRNFSPAVDV